MHEPDGVSIRVLHAEDDASFRELVADLLGSASDVEVVSEATPEDALARFEAEQFDCVVSDYDAETPGAFRPLIEATEGGPPCVLLTGKERERIDATASGAVDDYVRKGASERFGALAERVRTHGERYRSAERYRALFADGAGAMVVHDAETGEVIDANPPYAELLGYDREEATEMELSELILGEEPYTVERAMARIDAAANGETQRFEWVNVTAEGERVPVEVTLRRMEVAGAGRVLATVRDISERKRREAALERHKRHLEQLHTAATRLLGAEGCEAVYDGVLEAAESVFDPAFCAVVSREDDRLVPVAVGGREADEPGETLPTTERPEWDAVETGETQTYETDAGSVLCVPLGGHGVLCLRGYAPTTEHARELAETLGSHAAVALDRAEREAQLRERSQRRDSLAAAFPDYVFFLDADGVYQEVWVSPHHEERGGKPPSELEGTQVCDRISDAAAATLTDAIGEALSTGETQEVEYAVEVNAREIWFEAHVAPFPVADASEVVVVARDITTQRQYERRLEAQNERLDEFASMVSHDLRNPLNVVQGRLELIESVADDPDAVREHVAAAGSATGRMNDLIEDLLTVARTDERSLTVAPVGLQTAAERAWSSVSEPEASLEADTDARVRADSGELIRLLENLFRNAVEHVGRDVSVTVEALEDGFAVEDDGSGIPATRHDLVFESGYSTAETGTGYGLDIVERVAEAHGWSVALGDGDAGARFEVTGVESADAE
ncbi:PAS domain S-box protein [Halolamina litorea]|uniref:histidine kinase n=1 Tax=Halolamina litorea TaxID=1515593 RepID=A0ABD6BQN4_9EURY|nr:PAS domain S-box protein [Halolamina litorea]